MNNKTPDSDFREEELFKRFLEKEKSHSDKSIFDDEKECREYENEKTASGVKGEIIFYDYDNEEIKAPFNKINPNKVYGMVIKTRKAIEAVRDYFTPLGYIIPDDFDTEESGCWVWSDEEGEWLIVEEAKQEIEERLEDYNRMLKELENVKKIMNRG